MLFSNREVERYARHLMLKEIGGPGQQRLKASRILMVGVGGLGAPAALYLAAAGAGHLVLADPDRVELSNLQRQVIFTEADVGQPKVAAAAAHLAQLNPDIEVTALEAAVTKANAGALVAQADLVLDGSDNFATRFLVNEACVRAGRTLVTGAAARWSGRVGVFSGRPCFRCLVSGDPDDADGCAAVGVIGALDGVIGSMMALEAIKLVTRAGQPMTDRLLVYEGLTATTYQTSVSADPDCPVCSRAAVALAGQAQAPP